MYQSSITLFLSAFVAVFLLGLQSQFVRDKVILQSFITSLGIGLCQVLALKLTPNADLIGTILFILGGALGIVVSIYTHTYFKKRNK